MCSGAGFVNPSELCILLHTHDLKHHQIAKKNIAARLQYAQDHPDKPEGYWKNVLKNFLV